MAEHRPAKALPPGGRRTDAGAIRLRWGSLDLAAVGVPAIVFALVIGAAVATSSNSRCKNPCPASVTPNSSQCLANRHLLLLEERFLRWTVQRTPVTDPGCFSLSQASKLVVWIIPDATVACGDGAAEITLHDDPNGPACLLPAR